ncbi:TPA: MSHA biogenesis protein MshK [Vibrio vulnificus]|nr:MSHA biogenesis protein MshK [Vibrio vulnificus]
MVRFLLLSLCFAGGNAYATQDPTAPLGWTKPAQTKPSAQRKYRLPTLQSIVCQSPKECVAILNDDVVSVGETIRGYKVTQIDSDVVTLKRGSKLWKLELFNLDIKE